MAWQEVIRPSQIRALAQLSRAVTAQALLLALPAPLPGDAGLSGLGQSRVVGTQGCKPHQQDLFTQCPGDMGSEDS